MKLVAMQFSPVNSVKPRYLPQHPVVKDAQPVFFPWCERPGVTAV